MQVVKICQNILNISKNKFLFNLQETYKPWKDELAMIKLEIDLGIGIVDGNL